MSDQVFHADHNDAMRAASEKARSTFKYFWRELYWECRRVIPGTSLTAIKAEFRHEDVVEHMWVGDPHFDGYEITGELLNTAQSIPELCAGEYVTIPMGERFTDWMMVLLGEVHGGYSIHEMRKRMSDEERQGHDDAWGLPFGDPDNPTLPVFTDDPDDDHPMAESMRDMFVEFLDESPEEATNTSPDGWTMLHHEALAGNRILIELALERGADKSVKTNKGDTAADLAKLIGWDHLVPLLT